MKTIGSNFKTLFLFCKEDCPNKAPRKRLSAIVKLNQNNENPKKP
jgi:hypothetical protein